MSKLSLKLDTDEKRLINSYCDFFCHRKAALSFERDLIILNNERKQLDRQIEELQLSAKNLGFRDNQMITKYLSVIKDLELTIEEETREDSGNPEAAIHHEDAGYLTYLKSKLKEEQEKPTPISLDGLYLKKSILMDKILQKESFWETYQHSLRDGLKSIKKLGKRIDSTTAEITALYKELAELD